MLAVQRAAPTRRPVVLLDARTLEPLPTQPGGFRGRRWHTQDLDFSADGRVLAATMYRVQGHEETAHEGSGRAFVWDVAAPQHPLRVIRLKVFGWESLALNPNGRVLYVTDPLAAYDVATGERVRIPVQSPETVYQLGAQPGRPRACGTTFEGSTLLIDTRPRGPPPAREREHVPGRVLRRRQQGRRRRLRRAGGAGLGCRHWRPCGAGAAGRRR